jgi:hypothetical protein
VRLGHRPLSGTLLVVLVFAWRAAARDATLTASTRLRESPTATSPFVGDLPSGTRVEILGERGSWRQVLTPEGRTGFLWAENLAEVQPAPKPPEAPRRAEVPKPPAPGLAEEVRQLREEVGSLGQHPAPASAADLERLRIEIERLATVQRELTSRLDDRPLPLSGTPPPADGTLGLAPALLVVGGVLGWTTSRLVQRRRDRRQRNRIRL